KGSGEFLHFFFKCLIVFFYLFEVNVSSRSQDIIVFANILNIGRFTKTWNVFVFAKLLFASPFMVSVRDLSYILVGQFTLFSANHCSHLSGVNKKHFMGAVSEFVGFSFVAR